MSRSIQEEILSILWFILALLLWAYTYKILSILALLKGIECTIFSLTFAALSVCKKYYEWKLKAKQKQNYERLKYDFRGQGWQS